MGLILKTKITEQQAQDAATSAETAAQFNSLNQKLQDEAIARENSDIYLTNELLTESRLRKEADESLQANLDSETSLRIAADAKLQQNLDAETLERKAADDKLRQDFEEQDKTLSTAILGLDESLTNETKQRQDADSKLSQKIAQEISDRETALTDMQNAIMVSLGDAQSLQNIENENLKKQIAETAAENSTNVYSLQNKLNAEIENRKNADSAIRADLNSSVSTLNNKISNAETSLTNSITSARTDFNSALNTLENKVDANNDANNAALDAAKAELNTAISTVQTNLNAAKTSINSTIAQTKNDLNSSISNLQSNFNDKSAKISADISKLQSDVAANSDALAQEISDRSDAINDMQAAILVSLGDLQALQNIENENLKKSISEQATNQSGSVQILSSKLEQEISDRKAADSALSKNISDEIADRNAAVETLAQNINAESTARNSAVDNLNSKIETEISNRTAEDSKIAKSISDEVTARTTAINDLNSALNSTINSKASDTLSEAKSYADTKFNGVANSLNDFTAATATANGVHGLVPAPPKGTTLLVLTNYGWRQLDDDAVQIANTPNQANVLTYNGSSQSPTWANFDTSKMSLGGTTSGTNAGSYNATFTPTGFYTWADTKDQSAKTVAWTIGALYLNKPAAATLSFPYDGKSKSLTVDNYNSTYMNRSGKTSASAVGNYSVTYSLKNTTNTKWQDGSTGSVQIDWEIIAPVLTELQSSGFAQEGTLTYNGNSQKPTISRYDSSVHTLGGTTSARDAGTYSATISPKTNYKWYDGSTDTKPVSWFIDALYLDKPALQAYDFTYAAGTSRTPTINNSKSKFFTSEGTVTAINAGTYSVTYTLKNPGSTKWKDGTTEPVNLNWKIDPIKLTKPTLPTTSFVFDEGTRINMHQTSSTYSKTGYDSSTMKLASSYIKQFTGTYTETYTLKDTTNYCWDDGSTEPVVIPWTIEKRIIPLPYVTSSSLTYNGKMQTFVPIVEDPGYAETSGTYRATDIGEYECVVKLKYPASTTWADGSTDTFTFKWQIVEVGKLAKPATVLIYEWEPSGTITLEPQNMGFHSDTMTISGTLSAPANELSTNTVTISITDKKANTWTDGTTDDVTLNWYVGVHNVYVPYLSQSEFTFNNTLYKMRDYMLSLEEDYAEINTETSVEGGRWAYEGYYTAIRLKDKNHCQWITTRSTDDVILNWKIKPLVTKKPSLMQNSFAYSGTEINIQDYLADFNSTGNLLKIGGTSKATDSGNYSVTVGFVQKDTAINGVRVGITNGVWEDGSTDTVTFSWSISGDALTKPTIANTNFTFNASEQAPVISNFNSDTMTVSGTQKATNAGDYSITYSLKDKTNTTWSDGTTDDVTLNWKINVLKLPKVTASQTTFEYTGSTVGIADYLSNFNTNYIKLDDGYTTTVAVSTRWAYFALKNKTSTTWEDGTTGRIVIQWNVTAKPITKPALVKSAFDYTGSTFNAELSGFDSNLMTKSGTESASNVGTYSITVKLKDSTNYQWADGSTADLNLTWQIVSSTLTKEQSTLTPNPQNIIWYNSGYDFTKYLDGFNENYMTASGQTSGSDVGEYTMTVSLKSGYSWSDGSKDPKSIKFNIVKASIPIPVQIKSAFTYTGEKIGNRVMLVFGSNTPDDNTGFTIEGAETTKYSGVLDSRTYVKWSCSANTETSVYGVNATNAGTYTATASLVYPKNIQWADGTTADKTFTWTIEKMKLDKPTLNPSGYHTMGGERTPEIVNFDDNWMTASGELSAAKAGIHNITVALKDKVNTSWADGSTDDVALNWTITYWITDMIDKPEIISKDAATYSYNGKPYTWNFVTIDEDKVSITGDLSATERGNYKITFALKNATYRWSDYTYANVIQEWAIV